MSLAAEVKSEIQPHSSSCRPLHPEGWNLTSSRHSDTCFWSRPEGEVMDGGTSMPNDASPSLWRWVLGFLMVGACWGLTTPFMRRAAIDRDRNPQPAEPYLSDANVPWIKRKAYGITYAVLDLLKNPAYAIPLLLNVTGSVWFFLLIGQAELSLTVPITNSLAFLFTVLGERYAEGKVIQRDTWIGMILVLGGIVLCVHSKTAV